MHKFKKSLGQNFFRSSKFPSKIAEILDIKENEWIIEIGPGEGALTKQLIEKNANILAIEYDYELLHKLFRKFHNIKNFYLEYEDILKIDLNKLIEKYKIKNEFKVCGSLPYNISKKIIEKFVKYNFYQNNNLISKCVFVVQEEVAKEYVAKPPKSSKLSILTSIYANLKKHQTIPAKNFYPIPKVNGAILEIKPNKKILETENIDVKKLEQLIKISFANTRKTLYNNLLAAKISREILDDIFNKENLSKNLRAEETDIKKMICIYDKIKL